MNIDLNWEELNIRELTPAHWEFGYDGNTLEGPVTNDGVTMRWTSEPIILSAQGRQWVWYRRDDIDDMEEALAKLHEPLAIDPITPWEMYRHHPQIEHYDYNHDTTE